ncbi:hypothetical protein MDA_GLEAN10001042 [Myotis davidii]|uniref:Uncharacterized protein n=1 Tax=Myotis davidii TaxID=225400 RepID=L5M7X1_MYODS|nr:hypothetical protein MDA_GLEAN10001042 [Myotis davidii]
MISGAATPPSNGISGAGRLHCPCDKRSRKASQHQDQQSSEASQHWDQWNCEASWPLEQCDRGQSPNPLIALRLCV